MAPEAPAARTWRLTVAYDGAPFSGWQRQAEGVTVQAALEEALASVVSHPIVVHGAGRTDAGVHALGQVAHAVFAWPAGPEALQRALNGTLPAAIRVMSAAPERDGFHARFDAVAKTYRYLLIEGELDHPFARTQAWRVPGRLDLRAMQLACRAFVGTHDFAAFGSTGSRVETTVRTIVESVLDAVPLPPPLPAGRCLAYQVTGTGFLRHMVRAIVGTLVEVGEGRRGADTLPALVARRSRAAAGPTAPPQGLYLVRVHYDASAHRSLATGAGGPVQSSFAANGPE